MCPVFPRTSLVKTEEGRRSKIQSYLHVLLCLFGLISKNNVQYNVMMRLVSRDEHTRSMSSTCTVVHYSFGWVMHARQSR
jgi:hypothetical protein